VIQSPEKKAFFARLRANFAFQNRKAQCPEPVGSVLAGEWLGQMIEMHRQNPDYWRAANGLLINGVLPQ
jgi:hypothetical protein